MVEQAKQKRQVQPMECASIHYTCEQIEDSIQRLHNAINLFKGWKSTSEKDLERYKEANYLGKAKDGLIKSKEEDIEREGKNIIKYEKDINHLLEILNDARTLEKRILNFWEERRRDNANKGRD